jgi:hypothetical protein
MFCSVCVLTPPGASLTLGSRVLVGEIQGLPVISHIAAGQQHALLSDGERVWVIGKTMDQAGKVGGCGRGWGRILCNRQY